MSLASPRPEMQVGATVIAARLHDWPALLEQSFALSQRTRDLRIGVLLCESLAQLHQWNGLADGLEILWCWTTQLWSEVYPELDAEENNDPTARLSALAHLVSDQFIQRTLYQLPLAEHTALGILRIRDTVTVVKGKKEVSRVLTDGEIEAFFAETSALALAMRLRNVDRCCAAVEAMDDFLNGQPGTDAWTSARLLEILYRARGILHQHLADHQLLGLNNEADQPRSENAATTDRSGASLSMTVTTSNSAASDTAASSDAQLPSFKMENTDGVTRGNLLAESNDPGLSGPLQIRSRNDATAAIDAVCDYFRSHEPASPVPLLLQRAKRLISMNFIELMHELAPNEAMQLLRQLHVVDKAG